MVGTYLNVYSKYDWKQKVGGASPWAGTAGSIIGGLIGNWPGAVLGGILGAVLGQAGRTDSCAVNIGIDRAPGIGKVSHEDLHTASVWYEMEAWLVRANHGLHPENLSYCGLPVHHAEGYLESKYARLDMDNMYLP
jgi:hypothetical protein